MTVGTDVRCGFSLLPLGEGREKRGVARANSILGPFLAVSQGERKFPSDAIQAFDNSGAFSKYGYTATEFKSLFGQTR